MLRMETSKHNLQLRYFQYAIQVASKETMVFLSAEIACLVQNYKKNLKKKV